MSSPEQPQTDSAGRFLDSFAGGETSDQLTDHAYDGIEEFDNPLPGWWKWLFVATILFAFPYAVYYHAGDRRTLEALYAEAAAENARLQFAEIGELDGDATTLVKATQDPTMMSIGQSVFQANCVSCHGNNGGGLVGPNLTDDYYKNIREIEDFYAIINNGAAAGAMPAWKNRLSQNERVLVAAYAANLRGTDPGGGAKGPEGQEIGPWPEYVPPESGEATEGGDGADPDAVSNTDDNAEAAEAQPTDGSREESDPGEQNSGGGTPDRGHNESAGAE